MTSRLWALRTLLIAAISFGPTRAGAQAPADLQLIAERSDAIVLARGVSTHSRWDEGARVIVTDVTLEVERSFKGDHTATIAVRTLGGRVGRLGMGASHAAAFAPGARVVALLRRSRFGPYFVVTSARAGALPVAATSGGAHVSVGTGLVEVDDFAAWLLSNAR